MAEIPRKRDFVEWLEVDVVYIQRPHLPERSEVDDMLFENLGSDPPATEFERSNERGNPSRRRWDGGAPTSKARFVPKRDVFEEYQLTSNPPRFAYQRTAA